MTRDVKEWLVFVLYFVIIVLVCTLFLFCIIWGISA